MFTVTKHSSNMIGFLYVYTIARKIARIWNFIYLYFNELYFDFDHWISEIWLHLMDKTNVNLNLCYVARIAFELFYDDVLIKCKNFLIWQMLYTDVVYKKCKK